MDDPAQVDSHSGSQAGSKNVLRFGNRRDSTILSVDNNEAVEKEGVRDRKRTIQMLMEMGGGQRKRKRIANPGVVRTPLRKLRF